MAGCARARDFAVMMLAASATAALLMTADAMAGQRPDVVALAPQDVGFLNRIKWGANAPGADLFAKLGAEAFLEQQLHPPANDRLPQLADRKRHLLQLLAIDARCNDPGGARSGDFTARLEHALSCVSRVHAALMSTAGVI
jgi:hypothetical protein